MLDIFNDLKPFFEDCYRRVNIREYARIRKISPPSASKLLGELMKEGLLKMKKDRNYIFYYANKDSAQFVLLSRIFWIEKFKKSGLVEHLEKELINPTAIVFGSFSKAEITEKSDIDLAIFTLSKNKLNLEAFEKKLGRKIQSFRFKNREDTGKELLNNILNGFALTGGW